MRTIATALCIVALGALSLASQTATIQDKPKTSMDYLTIYSGPTTTEARFIGDPPKVGDCFKLSAAYTLEKIACPSLAAAVQGNAPVSLPCKNSYTNTPMPCDANACGSSDGQWTNCSKPPPFDVPGKDTEGPNVFTSCGTDACFGPSHSWSCADDKRSMVFTEDGKRHCYAFYLLGVN